MRFPWQRRADRERKKREAAEHRLAGVVGQWPEVHAAVAPLRRERNLNGWTDTIVSIFEAPESRKGHK